MNNLNFAADVDFVDKVTEFTFSSSTGTQQCVTLNIIDDPLFETDEIFTLRLQQDGQPDQSVQVIIISDDPLPTTISLAMSSYSVNEESGSVEICVMISGDELPAPASIQLVLEDISATRKDSYFANY